MKKTLTLLCIIIGMYQASGQILEGDFTISDSDIQTYIDANIVPNASNAITATKLNTILSQLNYSKLNIDSTAVITTSGDTIFIRQGTILDTLIFNSSWSLTGNDLINLNTGKVTITDSLYINDLKQADKTFWIMHWNQSTKRVEKMTPVALGDTIAKFQAASPTALTTWVRDSVNGYLYTPDTTDMVGIGTATIPTEMLDVDGNINIPNSTSITGQLKQNGATIYHNSNNFSNTFLGHSSGNFTNNSFEQTAFGFETLSHIESGTQWNSAFGTNALHANTIGHTNTAIGAYSLGSNTEGVENCAIGHNTLSQNTLGDLNCAMGEGTLEANISGTGNTSIGNESMLRNKYGLFNSAYGCWALYQVEGDDNVGIGYRTGWNLKHGNRNILIGDSISVPDTTTSNYLNIGNALTGNLEAGNLTIKITDSMYVAGNLATGGMVGIGSSPLAPITVNHSGVADGAYILRVDGTAVDGGFRRYGNNLSFEAYLANISVFKVPTGSLGISFQTTSSNDHQIFFNTNTGFLGLHTIYPYRALDINEPSGNCLRLIHNDSDGSAANYADFTMSSGGDLTITPSGGGLIYGDTFYRDVNVSALSLAGGVSAPTLTAITGGILGQGFNFQTANDIMYGQAQMNHDYKLATDIDAHLHYSIPSSPASGSDTVVIEFEYSWADVNEAFPTSTTVTKKIATYTASGGGFHRRIDLADITGNGGDDMSSVIVFRIERMQNSASDTYAGFWILHDVDFHIQIDSPGSDAELVK